MGSGMAKTSRDISKRRGKAAPLRSRSPLDRLAWDNLRLLLALADAGSFRSAAALAGVALNTLRAKVDRLEVQFGTPLLIRSVEGARLTQEGYELVAIARQMQALGRSAKRVQLPAAHRSPCDVRITVTEGIGTFWMMPRLIEFRSEHPEVRVELNCDMSPTEVLFRDTDIAIQLSRPLSPGMVVERLACLHVMPFASEDYLAKFGKPSSITDAGDHQLVWQQADQIATEMLVKHVDVQSAAPTIAIQTNTSSAHYWAVSRGAGIGFLPTYATAVGASPVPLDVGIRFRRELFLVHHPDAARNAQVRAALDWLRSAFDGTRYPWFAEDFIHPDTFEAMLSPADRARFEGFAPR
jgi:DNA-binding transcriptional LysR family regulator